MNKLQLPHKDMEKEKASLEDFIESDIDAVRTYSTSGCYEVRRQYRKLGQERDTSKTVLHNSRKCCKRAIAVRMAMIGKSYNEISEILGISKFCVGYWKK